MAVDHNNPQSRDEEILIATIDGTEYNKLPQSRMEELLLELKEVIEESGGGGTSDYTRLQNLPKINNVTLTGDMTAEDLSLVLAEVGKGLSTNDYSDAEKAKVANLVTSIQSILDGTDIDSFGDVEIALLDKADISDLGTAAAKDSTNAVTAGSTDLVESGAVKDAIDTAVSSAYHHAGTKTVAQLTHDLLIAANEGNVYNVTDSGTTTSDFIEGIGKTIDEGSNVGICKVGNVYMFDLLSGFVDTSNFVQKSETAGLLNNDGTVNTTIEGDVDDLQEWTSADTKSATGNPITVSDAAAVKAKALSMSIEPIQDLHGYDHPWVGGAGKNKLPLVLADIKAANTTGTWNGNEYTENDVTWTILTDNAGNITGIKANGTASANSLLVLKSSLSYTSDVILSDGNTYDRYSLFIEAPYGGSYAYSGYTIPKDSVISAVRLVVLGGVSVTNVISYPMIRLSTETDATFAPYENICPISGLTSADVVDNGNDVWVGNDNYTIASSGHIVPNTNITLSAGTYSFEFDMNTPVGDFEFEVFKSNSVEWTNRLVDKAFHSNSHNAVEFTINESATNLRLWSTSNTGAVISNVRLYSTKNTATITFGEEVFGGTVDFNTGKVRVSHGILDLGSLTYTYEYQYARFTSDIIVAMKAGEPRTLPLTCECYEVIDDGRPIQNVSDYSIYNRGGSGGVHINDSRYTDPSDVATALDGMQLVYPLATPTELTLTPAQLELLKGNNTITANGATISLTYQPDNLVGEVMEQVDEKVDGANAYTDSKVAALLPTYPTTDGAYVLTATVASGETVLSWESAT